MRLLLGLSGLLLASSAHAGGYYFADSGVVAASRGGAWVAGADNQFAQLYNPAGLVRIDGPTFNFGMSAVYQGVQFERLDQAGTPMDPIENLAGPFPVPQFGFAMPIGDQFAVALGGISGLAPDVTFLEDGAQRYTLIDSSIWQYAVAASLAWKPVKGFSVGAGVSWQIFRAAERLKVTTSLIPNADGTDRPQDDVMIALDTWDVFTPGFNMGVLVDPAPWMSVGLSVVLPSKFASRGSASMDFTGHSMEPLLNEVVITDDNVQLNITMPMIVRMGVAVRPWEHTEIELAADYETWGSLTEILVEGIDVEIDLGGIKVPVPEEIALPAGFRDSFSVRLGGETEVSPDVSVRAGVAWESAALTPEQVSVALMDSNKVYVGAGAGIELLDDRMVLDFGAGFMAYQTLDIKNSTVSSINVMDEDKGFAVGNGKLSAHGWVLSAQLSYRLGSGSK
jgi:long-chain fatty acid transport protein